MYIHSVMKRIRNTSVESLAFTELDNLTIPENHRKTFERGQYIWERYYSLN